MFLLTITLPWNIEIKIIIHFLVYVSHLVANVEFYRMYISNIFFMRNENCCLYQQINDKWCYDDVDNYKMTFEVFGLFWSW